MGVIIQFTKGLQWVKPYYKELNVHVFIRLSQLPKAIQLGCDKIGNQNSDMSNSRALKESSMCPGTCVYLPNVQQSPKLSQQMLGFPRLTVNKLRPRQITHVTYTHHKTSTNDNELLALIEQLLFAPFLLLIFSRHTGGQI